MPDNIQEGSWYLKVNPEEEEIMSVPVLETAL